MILQQHHTALLRELKRRGDVLLSHVRWWTSHSYRIECDYEECKDRGPIAYIKHDNERLALAVYTYNGSAYYCEDGNWYGPQSIKEIITLRWHSGDSRP